MIRHLVIHITILTGFVWCSDQPYSDYQNCTSSNADDSHCYTSNSVFKSWKKEDIDIYQNAENLCRNKIEYINLINCKNTVMRRCLPDDRTKDLFATAGAEEKGFRHVCSRPEDMRVECLSIKEFVDCQSQEVAKIGRLSNTATFEDWKVNHCRHMPIIYECARNSNKMKLDCPETWSLFLEYRRIIYPKACGDLPSTPNGQPSIFPRHLLSFSQLILISIIKFF